jgi:hypothetical protein
MTCPPIIFYPRYWAKTYLDIIDPPGKAKGRILSNPPSATFLDKE